MILFKLSPILFSDDITFASYVCLVNEQASLIKACLKSTDDCFTRESHFQMNLFVDFIPDIIKTISNKDNFIYIIKLSEEECTLAVLNWFQILKNLNHEVLVLKVAPWVETMSLSWVLVWNAEVVSEVLQESAEQEIGVDLPLNFNWKLLNKSFVSWCADTLVFVISPSIIEILFDSNFHVVFDTLSLIELLNKPKELWKVISIIKLLVHS